MRADKKSHLKPEKKAPPRSHKRGVVGYGKKTALLEDAITQMNAGKYGRSSAALKELLSLDPHNMEARRLFATLHLRLGSLIPARQAFDSLINEALERQDYWLAESLLREYLAVGPRCVPFLEKLGGVHEEKGDALEAVAEYGKAIDILIEDPDSENPQHAAQLYAKIRELAPASPVAFRLASSFDAQSGALTARPKATSAQESISHEPADGSPIAAVSPLEPGVMPWEVQDSPTIEPAVDSSLSTASAGEQLSTDLADSQSNTAMAEMSVSDRERSFVESGLSGAAEVNRPDGEIPVVESVQSNAGTSTKSTTANAEPMDALLSFPSVSMEEASTGHGGNTESEAAATSIASHTVPVQSQPFTAPGSSLSEAQAPSGAGTVSAPMPWEAVQEATIRIPDPVTEPVADPAQSLPEPGSVLPDDQAPSGAGSVSVPMPCEAVQESAIRIPDPVTEPVADPAQSLPEPGSVLLDDQRQTGAGSVSAPMPWETVQEAAIHIPEPVIELVANPVQAVTEPESSLLDTQAQTGVESVSVPLPWEAVQEAASHIPDPVAEPVADPAQSVTEPEYTLPDAQAPTGAGPVSTPMLWESVQESASHISEPMALNVLTSPAVSTTLSSSLDVSGSSAEETGAASRVSMPEMPPADPLPEVPKKEAFSWESLFSRGWKSEDHSPASVPSPPSTQPDTDRPNHAPVVSASTDNRPAADSTEAASIDQKDLETAQVPATESIVGPMPLDHVQPAVIATGATERAESTIETMKDSRSPNVAEPLFTVSQESVQSPCDLENLRSLESVKESVSLSVIDSSAVPLVATESEFRLLKDNAVSPVDRPSADTAPSEQWGSTLAAEYESVHAPEDSALGSGESTEEAQASKHVQPSDLIEPSAAYADISETPQQDAPSAPTVAVATPTPVLESLTPGSMAAEPRPHGEEQAVGQLPSIESNEPATALGHGVEAPAAISSPDSPLAISEAIRNPLQAEGAVPNLDRSSAPSQVPPACNEDPSHWQTGEVAVQVYRPTPNDRQKPIPPFAQPIQKTPHAGPVEEPIFEPAVQAAAGPAVAEAVRDNDEWIRTGESIGFTKPLGTAPEHGSLTSMPADAPLPQPVSSAASAVDVLFASSDRLTTFGTSEHTAEPKPRRRFRAKLARTRIAISGFIGSCFSTTQAMIMSLVALIVLMGTVAVIGIGLLALTWMVMEETPSSAFHTFTTSPPRTMSDFTKNGYLLLLGFNAPLGQDPIQFGYRRPSGEKDSDMVAGCIYGPNGKNLAGQTMGSVNAVNGLFRARDPLARFKSHADTIKGWSGQRTLALTRYTNWLKLPFEDWGYGQSVSLPCSDIVLAHQLYVAEGFVLGADIGVDRLEADMEAWRAALAQATTLPMKVMALQTIRDDAAVASGLLAKPDIDPKMLGRVSKMARPLNQAELSIRWPMQNELVWASKSLDAQLKAERAEDLPVYAAIASILPLPKQRRLNQYAEYYDAASKVSGEGRYGSLPKRNQYIQVPANGMIDYLGNPIENIVGLEPLPEWNRYAGLAGDMDAHLRLVSLQAWLRRGPQDADLLARIAKAGQNFYDPYTGFPMLVNQKKGVLYSVGHDGRDQDADPETDIVVGIPMNHPTAPSAKSTSDPSSR